MKKITLLLIVFLFLVLHGCGKRTTDYYIDTCIVNKTNSAIKNIEITFSSRTYKIYKLEAKKKKCINMPLFSDADYGVRAYINGRMVEVDRIGYYTNVYGIKLQHVNLFLESNRLIENRLDDDSINGTYNYRVVKNMNATTAKQ